MSNLKQLHLANLQHAMDFNGHYVPLQGSKGYWLDNDTFGNYLQGENHNGWDDWPSVFKTGKSNANRKNGGNSKMSFGYAMGLNRIWPGNTLTMNKAMTNPEMIMFCDSTQYHVYGARAVDSAVEFDDARSPTPWGHMAFRYKGKAGIVTYSGQVTMVRHEDVLSSENRDRYFPDLNPVQWDY